MINFLLVIAHHGQPDEHPAHMEMCEGCGIYGPCCEFERFALFGHPTATVTMCKDKVRCGLRIHLMVHEPGRPYLGCTYCVSGTDFIPPPPPVPDTVQGVLDLIDGNPWRT